MIEPHVFARDGDIFTVSITVIAVDHSGSGIKKISVRDRFLALLGDESFTCEPTATLNIDRIEMGRFPISVEGIDCNEEKTPPVTFPLTAGPTGPRDNFHLPCSPAFCLDDPICLEADADASRARNEVIERCGEAAALRSRRDALAAAAAAAFVLAAALTAAAIAAAGTFFGFVVAPFLLFLAAAALFAGLGLAIAAAFAERDLERANSRLQNARDAFTEAADRASRACCRDCITADLTQPACP